MRRGGTGIDLVGRIADRGAEFVSAREWMRIWYGRVEGAQGKGRVEGVAAEGRRMNMSIGRHAGAR